jgi:hypothetical protein
MTGLGHWVSHNVRKALSRRFVCKQKTASKWFQTSQQHSWWLAASPSSWAAVATCFVPVMDSLNFQNVAAGSEVSIMKANCLQLFCTAKALGGCKTALPVGLWWSFSLKWWNNKQQPSLVPWYILNLIPVFHSQKKSCKWQVVCCSVCNLVACLIAEGAREWSEHCRLQVHLVTQELRSSQYTDMLVGTVQEHQ